MLYIIQSYPTNGGDIHSKADVFVSTEPPVIEPAGKPAPEGFTGFAGSVNGSTLFVYGCADTQEQADKLANEARSDLARMANDRKNRLKADAKRTRKPASAKASPKWGPDGQRIAP